MEAWIKRDMERSALLDSLIRKIYNFSDKDEDAEYEYEYLLLAMTEVISINLRGGVVQHDASFIIMNVGVFVKKELISPIEEFAR